MKPKAIIIIALLFVMLAGASTSVARYLGGGLRLSMNPSITGGGTPPSSDTLALVNGTDRLALVNGVDVLKLAD